MRKEIILARAGHETVQKGRLHDEATEESKYKTHVCGDVRPTPPSPCTMAHLSA